MTSPTRLLPLLLILPSFLGSLEAKEAPNFKKIESATPATRWEVKASPQDKVQLEDKQGNLIIDFDVEVNRLHQVGHETYPTGGFDLLLKEPLPLPQGTDRIEFEAIGNEWKSWNMRTNQVRLRPLIRDAEGEVLVYNGFPDERFHFAKTHPATKNDSVRWRRWVTRQFQTSEAGAATQDIFETRSENGNNFPDGELTFLGFEAEVRAPAKGRKAGRFVLGSFGILGGAAEAEDPWFYADAVCAEKGNYELGYEVSNSFQGLPIHSEKYEFAYDPEDIASRKKHLEFKLGPTDNYWISYRLIGPGGTVAASDHFRAQIYDREGSAPNVLPADQAPTVGYLRINPKSHTDGVYGSDEPMKVVARVFPAGTSSGERKLRWELLAYEFPEVLDKGEQALPATKAKYEDMVIDIKPITGRDAYRLKVTVEENGKTVDEVLYHLGRKTIFAQTSHPRPIPLCDREFIKSGSYNRVTVTKLSSVKFASEDEAVKYYEARLDEIQKITPHITYMMDVRDVQTLPGVYNFNLLDRVLDAAAKRGMAATIRFGHIDDEGEFTWIKYARQVNYDGKEIPEHYYGGFSVTDETYTKSWMDAFRALYNRYGSHPAFQGYYLLQPAGEFTVSDKPWEGLISDYAPSMRKAFRVWLQEKKDYSLADVNQRWSTEYKDWSEVPLPQPDFSLGQKPDLRPAWVDFCRFKAWLDKEYWAKRALTEIRSYDPHRVVICYSDPRTAEGLSDYGHNGGNHFFENLGAYMNAWYEHGTGWITEPHQPQKWSDYGDPKERGWVLDWSLWVAFAQAGAGGANLHVYYHPKEVDLLPHYGGEMGNDRMQRYFPILQELHSMEMTLPEPEVAFLFDPHTLYTKHRTTFSQRIWDLKRFGELLDRDNVSFTRLQGEMKPDTLKGVKLVVANALDEVMSGNNISLLKKAVQEDGAKLIMTANTGKYSPEHQGQEFVLLRELGITPPTGEYIVQEAGVTATASGKDNPLFKNGEKIRFFSLADLRKDLDSDEVKIRENFWSYPYRWLPLTDYYGYYRDNKERTGKILATFPSGAPAVSLHASGRGEVIVFWGLPDYKRDNLPSFMAHATQWAGAESSHSDNPLPLMREGKNSALNRHYALIYNDNPGEYRQKIEFLPDGDWFVDEMVSDQRLGRVSGKVAREQGLDLTFDETYSPLKVLRFIPREKILSGTKWPEKYPDLNVPASNTQP